MGQTMNAHVNGYPKTGSKTIGACLGAAAWKGLHVCSPTGLVCLLLATILSL